jgi:hypothetical protein
MHPVKSHAPNGPLQKRQQEVLIIFHIRVSILVSSLLVAVGNIRCDLQTIRSRTRLHSHTTHTHT